MYNGSQMHLETLKDTISLLVLLLLLLLWRHEMKLDFYEMLNCLQFYFFYFKRHCGDDLGGLRGRNPLFQEHKRRKKSLDE